MLDEAELRRMSPGERARLVRAIAAIDKPISLGRPAAQRHRAIFLAAIIACCVGLAIWTSLLALTLPRYYRAGDWRGAWVGFDLALLVTFVVTAWAAWRRRQVLIICLVVLATLLCCDAWFDVTLDVRTSGFMLALLSAIFIELPLAAMAIIGARRLVRLTIGMVVLDGNPRPRLPLWRVPLFGVDTPAWPGLIPVQRPSPAVEDCAPRQAENQDAR
ncbi:MAG TPA: hypothetical protein VGA04_13885 [Streptosporangiaceae bacterium]